MKLDITSDDIRVVQIGLSEPRCGACRQAADPWRDNPHSVTECIRALERRIDQLEQQVKLLLEQP